VATATPTSSATPRPTATTTPTDTPKPTATLRPTRTPRPTYTRRPTRTPKPPPTDTATPTPLPDLFRLVAPIDVDLPGWAQDLQIGPGGTAWLTTDQAAAKLSGSTWSVYLSDISGELVGVDTAGRAWVVNEDFSEISAWDGTSWTAYAADAGWAPITGWYRRVDQGQIDASGRLWLSTSQDVRVLDGERWIVFTPEEMGMGPPAFEDLMADFELAVLRDGSEIWVGGCDWGGPGPFGGRGVRWFDGQAWRGSDGPVATGCVTVIEEDPPGRVWVGVDDALWRYDPVTGDWAQLAAPNFGAADGRRHGFVTDLALDRFGDPWLIIALCGGASCFAHQVPYHVQDGVWTQLAEPREMEFQRVVVDGAGTPWLFWSGDIYRMAGDTPELMAELFARSITVDANGRVWFLAWRAGQDGLWTLDADESLEH
jgi:hypothetical protein